MDYPCGKFGDCSFSRFGFIMWTDRHKHTQTDADDCYTHTTPISVSNDYGLCPHLYCRGCTTSESVTYAYTRMLRRQWHKNARTSGTWCTSRLVVQSDMSETMQCVDDTYSSMTFKWSSQSLKKSRICFRHSMTTQIQCPRNWYRCLLLTAAFVAQQRNVTAKGAVASNHIYAWVNNIELHSIFTEQYAAINNNISIPPWIVRNFRGR